nr:MAG: ORF1 [Torque teno polar bear virus 23]
MAWRYRRRFRRRRPLRRRWRRRARRRPYRRRAPRRRYFRYGFRRRRLYRRRAAVRRRRGRWGRKRQYLSNVTQWNPAHRIGCKIRGWMIMAMCIKGHFAERNEILWKGREGKPDKYYLCGGSVSYKHFTLGILYQEHLMFRNVWTRSNAGYDLARYFGTKFMFWPHPLFDYMVYWETNFEIPEATEMPDLHPGVLINRKHMIVRSLRWRGRKKKLFIKPPPVHTNQWYFQKTWCNTPLLKIGVMPVNFRSPFLHKSQQYGVWIGYMNTNNLEAPKDIVWTSEDINLNFRFPVGLAAPNGGGTDKPPGSGGRKFISRVGQWRKRVYYRWWWDDGVDNYIMFNPRNNYPIHGGRNQCEIVKVNEPYWKYFWGLANITSTGSSLCVSGVNPSVYALTWYMDVECNAPPPEFASGPDATKTGDNPKDYLEGWQNLKPVYPPPNNWYGFPDQDLCSPDQIPGFKRRKFWVILSQQWPWIVEGSLVPTKWHLPDYDEVRAATTGITLKGPFTLADEDLAGEWPNMNIGMTYRSYWQWGGFRPRPDTTEDPCNVGGDNPPYPSKKRRTVQVENPADVSRLVIHPWDMEQAGIYTKETLKRLLSEVYPPCLTDPALQPPERPRSPNVQRRMWQGGDDRPSLGESSESSSESSESDEAWSRPASLMGGSSGDEATEETRPTAGTRVGRKRKRPLQLRLGKRVRRRLDRFLNERDARPRKPV